MARRTYTPAQREAAEQARVDTLERMHQQLTDNIAVLDGKDAWQRWLTVASKLHRYSFNNVLLMTVQNPDVSLVAGYRAWQALGHQVRRGEKALQILGPVTRTMELTDRFTGQPIRDDNGQIKRVRQMIGVRPVSVFDVSQVDPPLPEPPTPQLLQGEAPAGLWEALADIVTSEGYTLSRGDCGDANGWTNYSTKEVRVRADVDDAQAVKTLAHELGHVLLPPEPGAAGQCRGLREVEAESVAYMVTQAHGLDSGQYTFSYVAGWASQAATGDTPLEDIVATTGSRVIGAADSILKRTHPVDAETDLVDAVAATVGVTPAAGGQVPAVEPVSVARPVWETVSSPNVNGQDEALRRPVALEPRRDTVGVGR